jgi:hypothetical protein
VGGVGVHDFAVEARIGDAKAIALADYGSGVDDGDEQIFGALAAADERKNAVVSVVGVNPFETMPVEIDLMKGGLSGIEMIEIGDQAMDATMRIMLKQMPVEAASFAPFISLRELLTHEKKLLSRVSVLIAVEEAKIGELLPHVTGHFVEERVFAVDDFVVGEREKEIFGEGVEKRESEFVVFVFAMDGVVGKVF